MESKWYKNVILYTIDVKSFCDSNNDGIGDFPGLTSKLDYLSHLGITCIWLLPFFSSPLQDNGYDVIDYYTIDSRLGTLSEFKNFIRKSGERGINVVIDLVLNHTSNQHPWFQAARSDEKSIFREYYVWADTPPPNDPLDLPAFPDTEHGLWQYDEEAHSYYYHKFYSFQPDLHIANPKVREEIHKIIDFWLSMGVAGFRIDALPIMINKKGLNRTKPSNSQEIYCDMRKHVSNRNQEKVLMGEVDVDGKDLIDYFAEGQGLHLVFNFLLSAYLVGAIAQKNANCLIRGWRELPVIPDSGTWVNFLRNLDELNINQLPRDLREKVYNIMAPQEDMRIYRRGIRRRLAPMLDGDKKRIEMVHSLLFSLPGTPMITYGDEIGLGDELSLWEREAVRVPMQWSDQTNGGFSNAAKDKLIRPLVTDNEFNYSKINVEKQLGVKDSLLNRIKRLIFLRKMHPEIGHGRLAWVMSDHPSVLGHICHWKNDMLLAVHNLSGENLSVKLDLKTIYAKQLICLEGNLTLEPVEDGCFRLQISGYQYGWFRINLEKEV